MRHSKSSSSSSTLICDNDDRSSSAAVLREIMAREQSLVTQLRALVLPALQLAGGERAEVVAQMFNCILDCSAKAIAELKLLRLDRSRADDAPSLPPVVVVDDKRRVRKIFSGDGDNAKPNRQQRKRRRLADDSVTLETPVPHYDGHQWRKYGQKLINNAAHPRSYYKCAYKQEQDCRATKTVQQYQEEDGGTDAPAMYAVVYYGRHTCNPAGNDTDAAAVVKTESTGGLSSGGDADADELSWSDSQCSNISVTCTSVVVDHHQRTASIESNSKLLDMAADLTNAEVNTYDQLYDVAAFSPFDLDTDWATDAHGHGLPEYGDW